MSEMCGGGRRSGDIIASNSFRIAPTVERIETSEPYAGGDTKVINATTSKRDQGKQMNGFRKVRCQAIASGIEGKTSTSRK